MAFRSKIPADTAYFAYATVDIPFLQLHLDDVHLYLLSSGCQLTEKLLSKYLLYPVVCWKLNIPTHVTKKNICINYKVLIKTKGLQNQEMRYWVKF
jgi:hypothetical protein